MVERVTARRVTAMRDIATSTKSDQRRKDTTTAMTITVTTLMNTPYDVSQTPKKVRAMLGRYFQKQLLQRQSPSNSSAFHLKKNNLVHRKIAAVLWADHSAELLPKSIEEEEAASEMAVSQTLMISAFILQASDKI